MTQFFIFLNLCPLEMCDSKAFHFESGLNIGTPLAYGMSANAMQAEALKSVGPGGLSSLGTLFELCHHPMKKRLAC